MARGASSLPRLTSGAAVTTLCRLKNRPFMDAAECRRSLRYWKSREYMSLTRAGTGKGRGLFLARAASTTWERIHMTRKKAKDQIGLQGGEGGGTIARRAAPVHRTSANRRELLTRCLAMRPASSLGLHRPMCPYRAYTAWIANHA